MLVGPFSYPRWAVLSFGEPLPDFDYVAKNVLTEMDVCDMIKAKFSSKAKAYDLLDHGEKPIGCVRTVCSVKSYRTIAGGLEAR